VYLAAGILYLMQKVPSVTSIKASFASRSISVSRILGIILSITSPSTVCGSKDHLPFHAFSLVTISLCPIIIAWSTSSSTNTGHNSNSIYKNSSYNNIVHTVQFISQETFRVLSYRWAVTTFSGPRVAWNRSSISCSSSFIFDWRKSTLAPSNKVCICSRSVSIFGTSRSTSFVPCYPLYSAILTGSCCRTRALCPRSSSISSHESNQCYRMLLTELNSNPRQSSVLGPCNSDIVTVLFH
jgi:hypothetical protein